jgi:hypothetical protein
MAVNDSLVHDPRTKQQIKDALYGILYAPVNRAFEARLNRIINRNTQLGGHTHASFMFKNVVYNCDANPLPRKQNRLLPDLVPDMNAYLADLNELNRQELPYVMGYINQVLNASNDMGDYLRLLPSSVHGPIQQLIASCPCKTARLPQETVELLQSKNQNSIDLMKRRMVNNLLL